MVCSSISLHCNKIRKNVLFSYLSFTYYTTQQLSARSDGIFVKDYVNEKYHVLNTSSPAPSSFSVSYLSIRLFIMLYVQTSSNICLFTSNLLYNQGLVFTSYWPKQFLLFKPVSSRSSFMVNFRLKLNFESHTQIIFGFTLALFDYLFGRLILVKMFSYSICYFVNSYLRAF